MVLDAVVGKGHLLSLPSPNSFHAGLAFSDEERERLYLRGLLPPAVLSQEVQAERVLINIRSKQNDLDKHTYLTSLQVVHADTPISAHHYFRGCLMIWMGVEGTACPQCTSYADASHHGAVMSAS